MEAATKAASKAWNAVDLLNKRPNQSPDTIAHLHPFCAQIQHDCAVLVGGGLGDLLLTGCRARSMLRALSS